MKTLLVACWCFALGFAVPAAASPGAVKSALAYCRKTYGACHLVGDGSVRESMGPGPGGGIVRICWVRLALSLQGVTYDVPVSADGTVLLKKGAR